MAQASAPTLRPAPPPRDRVTLVVRCTLVLLLVIGVWSVFGDSLLGLTGAPPETSPPAAAPGSPAAPVAAPAGS